MGTDMTEQIMVRLPPDLHEQLKAEADRDERTVAQTVRLAIKQYLSRTVTPAG